MTVERKTLEELFHTTETDIVERKGSVADSEKIRQAIGAFANDLPNYRKPGIIFVGQKDDLSCAKLAIDDRLLQQIGSWRSDGRILPFPVMHVTKETIDDCEVAVVVVEPCDNPPVKVDGRTWIRTGPRRGIATDEEERRLLEKRRWGTLPYDAHGVPGSKADEIDLRTFVEEYLPSAIAPDTLRDDRRSETERLQALRFLNKDGQPTVTAILALGKDVRALIPGAYIQFLRVAGKELTDTIRNQKILDGTIGQQFRALDELIKANNVPSFVVTPGSYCTRRESRDSGISYLG